MNNLLNHRDDDLDDTRDHRDREITLGTTLVLAIFFGLAVVCAVFFGFGYSVGRKSAAGVGANGAPAASISFNGGKPSAGSPFSAPAQAKPGATSDLPYTAPPPIAPRPLPAKPADDVPLLATDTHPHEAAATGPVGPAQVTPAVIAAGQAMVQIAAVSHQEDADLLVSTLKRRNYSVAVHQEPQDKLLHVQVGPFASKKEAEAMRQRLLADGFNAIVKDAPKQ